MVRYLFLLCCIFPAILLHSQDVKVEAGIEENRGFAGYPIKGILIVTHPANKRVDPDSTIFEDEKLELALQRQTTLGNMQVSVFSFQLPKKDKGLYILSPIQISVGGSTYTTVPESYEVVQAPQIEPGAALSLEALVEGKNVLYPGERTKLVYRIYYTKSIDLTLEKLPLLDIENFKKIGDEQIRDFQQGAVTVQEISQEIEADIPGIYTFEPSLIEGFAYEIRNGTKLYEREKLQAEAPEVSITVKPFPEEQQPSSFNGAIGQFSFDVSLEGNRELYLGDVVNLQLTIKGKGNLLEIPPPQLLCQPGFSGLFQINPIGIESRLIQNGKEFLMPLQPISLFIQNIPPIEFSFFDPEANSYKTLRSEPIPIQIKGAEHLTLQISRDQAEAAWKKQLNFPQNFPENILILDDEQQAPPFKIQWLILLAMPFLLLIQLFLKKQFFKKKTFRNGEQFFKNAAFAQNDAEFIYLLKKAFLEKLKEIYAISSQTRSITDLPNENLFHEIKYYFSKLEETHFTGHPLNKKTAYEEAKKLFKNLTR